MSCNKSIVITAFLCCLIFIQDSPAQQLQLTKKEKIWLQQHPVIKLAYDKQFPPFEWKNNKGRYQGISVDIINKIEKKLHIKFVQIEVKNWSQALERFKAGEIDFFPTIAETEKRQNFLLFTRPHISIPGVIVSGRQYQNIEQLKGKKVGVVSDYIWDEMISKHDDEINIIRVETTQMGIELAVMGAIDAMVTDMASVSYIINRDGISNLKVVPVENSQKKQMYLAMGIRNDWPEFKNILQKALDSLEQGEMENIHNKWIKLDKMTLWQSDGFREKALIFSIVIITMFIVIIIWNRTLKQQVSKRTEQLEKAHKQLIHAEKMESIGRLSAGIAHEVKNPLAILQMSVDYLKGEDNDETINTILDDMDDAILRADKVIKGLLDFSREKQLQLSPGNINAVIEKSLRLIEHELKQKNITLKISLADDVPVMNMDSNRLQQVFINLFMNAVQAIESSNKLQNTGHELLVISTLSHIDDVLIVEQSEGRLKLQQKVIIIQVRDSGTGLQNNNEKNVFEPFFTTKAAGEGTGLGLSVSKTIIGLHHGMISMNNRTDRQGAEVTIYFAIEGETEQ